MSSEQVTLCIFGGVVLLVLCWSFVINNAVWSLHVELGQLQDQLSALKPKPVQPSQERVKGSGQ